MGKGILAIGRRDQCLDGSVFFSRLAEKELENHVHDCMAGHFKVPQSSG